MDFREILGNFNINSEVQSVYLFGSGHINETYLVSTSSTQYILQSLNTKVFPNYVGVMDNIEKVTSFQKAKYVQEGKDISKMLYLIKTKDDKNFLYRDEKCYRMFNFIKDSMVFQQTNDLAILEEAGFGLGDFISNLNGFDATKIVEVIPNFHNTKVRFKDFERAIREDRAYRAKSVKDDIDFVLARKDYSSIIVDRLNGGQIPLRVTHNDTKLNNFMFDEKTHKFTCLVDLDTIMPGSLLYDFGDAIRIAASTAGEEERDLSKVKFNIDNYEAFLKGFLRGIKDAITPQEAKLLHISAKIMTFEIGMRFLMDYLDGDVYFKVHEEDMNLVRARTQLKMVQEIEQNEKEMEKILYKYYNNI